MRARMKWARSILDAIAAEQAGRNMDKPLSLRKVSQLVGVSHQAPMVWLSGVSLPGPHQVIVLAKLANRDPASEVLYVEELRTSESAAQKVFRQVREAWEGVG